MTVFYLMLHTTAKWRPSSNLPEDQDWTTHRAHNLSRPWCRWGRRPSRPRWTSGRVGSCSGRTSGSCRLHPECPSVWLSWRSSFRIWRIWTWRGRGGGRCWRELALTLPGQTTTSLFPWLPSPVWELCLSWPLSLHGAGSEIRSTSLSGHSAEHLQHNSYTRHC